MVSEENRDEKTHIPFPLQLGSDQNRQLKFPAVGMSVDVTPLALSGSMLSGTEEHRSSAEGSQYVFSKSQ